MDRLFGTAHVLTKSQVGGSTGHDAIELATHHPNLAFIIQDRAELASSFADSVPSSLDHRLTFQSHDFFTTQPTKGASIYFLKHILHDWPDPSSMSILRQIVEAMVPFKNGKGSRILIMDSVMPEVGEVPMSVFQLNTSMDLQMMCALNAKERTRRDWEALVKRTDHRLRIVDVRVPKGSADGIIEVVLDR
jgi:6-hydroxytryprostatin B O-methyltransferase